MDVPPREHAAAKSSTTAWAACWTAFRVERSEQPPGEVNAQHASKTAGEKAAARPTAKKAEVLGQVQARGGKMYQVLAPAVAPQHLTMDDIERAVELMVAAR